MGQGTVPCPSGLCCFLRGTGNRPLSHRAGGGKEQKTRRGEDNSSRLGGGFNWAFHRGTRNRPLSQKRKAKRKARGVISSSRRGCVIHLLFSSWDGEPSPVPFVGQGTVPCPTRLPQIRSYVFYRKSRIIQLIVPRKPHPLMSILYHFFAVSLEIAKKRSVAAKANGNPLGSLYSTSPLLCIIARQK